MNTPEALENRLSAIGSALEKSGRAYALLGLGSVGKEVSRLDQWSDLDFFAVVHEGSKSHFLENLDWLAAPCPLGYVFKNTPDGFKLLYQDGIFAEMAVFEPQELASIPFAEGRVIWSAPGFDRGRLIPQNLSGRQWTPPSVDHALGELLTCLYVGMCRYRRGEKLSAWRFIQGYCLDRFLEIVTLTRKPENGFADPYSRDRRFEFLYPGEAAMLYKILAGYEGTPQAVEFFLEWIETVQPVNPWLLKAIKELIY